MLKEAQNIVTAERREVLEKRWRLACSPLAGCQPYTSRRPFRIRQFESGRTFLEVLESRFPKALSQEAWENVFRKGLLIWKSGEPVLDGSCQVFAGQQFVRLIPNCVEPAVATDLKVVDEDDVFLILDKPAPLPMHEGGRFFKNTLRWLMAQSWPELDVRYAHRLDAETSGLLICVKGEKYKSEVQSQFEQGIVEKTYLVRVLGHPPWDEKVIEHRVSVDGRPSGKRLDAETRVRILEKSVDGTSLIEAKPLTGRTHQIRVHLWQEGFPIEGDGRYQLEGTLGEVEIPSVEDTRLALRAWRVSLLHPRTGERVHFEVDRRFT